MWPFLLIPVAIAAIVAFRRSEAGRERRRGLKVVTILAVVMAVVGVLLLGIPGAVVYGLSAPWVQAMLGSGYRELGDGAWPAALVITLTWPFSIVLAYVLANGPLRRRGRFIRWTIILLFPYLVGILLALWAHLSVAP